MDESTVGDSAVGVANFNVGFNAAVPGSEGTVAEFDVLNLQKVSLPRFQFPPTLVIHENGIVGSPPLFNAASELGQREDQQNQSALQHNLSFDSLTLSLESGAVKQRVDIAQRAHLFPDPFLFLAGWPARSPTARNFLTRPPTDRYFYPPYPPIASHSISRDVLLARARASDFPYFALRGAARLSFTARIGRAPFHRARSASKKDGLAVPLPLFLDKKKKRRL